MNARTICLIVVALGGIVTGQEISALNRALPSTIWERIGVKAADEAFKTTIIPESPSSFIDSSIFDGSMSATDSTTPESSISIDKITPESSTLIDNVTSENSTSLNDSTTPESSIFINEITSEDSFFSNDSTTLESSTSVIDSKTSEDSATSSVSTTSPYPLVRYLNLTR